MHVQYLTKVFSKLQSKQLYAKLFKAAFAKSKIDYLGHIINEKCVAMNKAKVKCIINWATPITIKGLRGYRPYKLLYKIRAMLWPCC